MTATTLGRVSVECDLCPWPIHLSIVVDEARCERDGLLPALDAEGAGVPRALRVHLAMVHDIRPGEDGES